MQSDFYIKSTTKVKIYIVAYVAYAESHHRYGTATSHALCLGLKDLGSRNGLLCYTSGERLANES